MSSSTGCQYRKDKLVNDPKNMAYTLKKTFQVYLQMVKKTF